MTRSTKSAPGRWRSDLSIVLHWWESNASADGPSIFVISEIERDIHTYCATLQEGGEEKLVLVGIEWGFETGRVEVPVYSS